MEHVFVTLWLRDVRIFIDAPLNSSTRIDTSRHQHHVSILHRYDFSYFSLKLYMMVIFWLRDWVFQDFLAALFSSPAQLDIFRHQNHVSNLHRSNFSCFRSKLFLWPCDCVISGFYSCTIEFPGSSRHWCLKVSNRAGELNSPAKQSWNTQSRNQKVTQSCTISS